MTKIRYAELPAGLHVSAVPRGPDTIIYLQPGLTAAQRRAALARVRSSGRMGHGPPVSATRMAVAVSADKLRTTVRNGFRAMRGHPLLLVPPLVVLVFTALLVVPMSLVTVTAHQQFRTIADLASLVVGPARAPSQHGGATTNPPARPAAARQGRGPSELAPSPRTGQTPTPSPTSRPVPVRPSPLPTVSPPPSPAHGALPVALVRPGGPGSPRTVPRR